MDLNTGDKIRIFDNTNVRDLVKFIKDHEGFNVKIEKNYIVVGKPLRHKANATATECGKQIRKARRDKGMTREELAEACGVCVKSVYEWEIGRKYPKNINKVKQILGF